MPSPRVVLVVLAALALVHGSACGDDQAGTDADTEPCSPLDQLEIEYLAEQTTGELLLVLRPDSDALEIEQIRSFYGPENGLVERPIVSFERQRDGGTTHMSFRIDGASARASFPVESDGGAFMDGAATLSVAGETFDLELIASPIGGDAGAADALAHAHIECLRQAPPSSEPAEGPRYSPRAQR